MCSSIPFASQAPASAPMKPCLSCATPSGATTWSESRSPIQRPVPLSVQYSPEYLDSLEKVRNTPVVSSGGSSVTLGEIADVRVRTLPEMIRNDNGTLAGYVYVYLTNDVSPTDYVTDAQPFLAQALDLPAGYSLEWTGDYQYSLSARAQLQWIIPATLAIIFVLLLLAFHSVIDSLLIMLSVPFALVGGVFLQWVLGYSMTTAVVIGYIALFAIAIQTGIIMIVFIRQALARKTADETYVDAVVDGSAMRLRPKLMTVAITSFSFLPIMVSTGPGIEIMKPIATPTDRRHGQLHDLRPFPDSLPVCDRRGFSPVPATERVCCARARVIDRCAFERQTCGDAAVGREQTDGGPADRCVRVAAVVLFGAVNVRQQHATALAADVVFPDGPKKPHGRNTARPVTRSMPSQARVARKRAGPTASTG